MNAKKADGALRAQEDTKGSQSTTGNRQLDMHGVRNPKTLENERN